MISASYDFNNTLHMNTSTTYYMGRQVATDRQATPHSWSATDKARPLRHHSPRHVTKRKLQKTHTKKDNIIDMAITNTSHNSFAVGYV
jgi:hypothetical protein